MHQMEYAGSYSYGSDVMIALSYCLLTMELLYLTLWKMKLIKMIIVERNETKRLVILTVFATVIMFSLFIFLCGMTHGLRAAEAHISSSPFYAALTSSTMVLCAIVSCITALCGLYIFPFFGEALQHYELTEEGRLKLADDVNSYKDSFMVLDSNFTVVRGNLSSRTLFGPSFIQSSMLELIWDADDIIKVRSILEKLATSSNNSESACVEYKAYGDALHEDYCWLESTFQKKALTIKRSTGNLQDNFEIIVTTRNIDDRKKAEMYRNMLLATKEQEQQRIDQAKMLYVTCVAHDLKTPLQSFSFAMNLLTQSKLTNEQIEIINNAQVSVDLMKLTVSQAMHISKVQSGIAVAPRKSSVSITGLMQRVQIVMNSYGSPVPISYHISEALSRPGASIITDEEWLWQMILNLLTNACKYTTEGYIKISIDEADDGSMFYCSVADTGIGIDESKHATLFQAFAQAQLGQMEGTGLGLYGLRSRAEALGGCCGIRNNTEHGHGCIVWFKIPYVRDGDLDVEYTSSKSPASSPHAHSKTRFIEVNAAGLALSMTTKDSPSTITQLPLSCRLASASAAVSRPLTAIVVDDVLPIRKLMSRVLMSCGFTIVDCYANGLLGLQAMKAKQVDVVFTDIQMPLMSGPEMTTRFRAYEAAALKSGARSHKQVIVAVTANRSEDISGMDSSTFDLICSKPIEVQQIQHIIQTFCHQGPDNV
jgi:signal transduction histidine kinase/CheY-like chemotaxis protein